MKDLIFIKDGKYKYGDSYFYKAEWVNDMLDRKYRKGLFKGSQIHIYLAVPVDLNGKQEMSCDELSKKIKDMIMEESLKIPDREITDSEWDYIKTQRRMIKISEGE